MSRVRLPLAAFSLDYCDQGKVRDGYVALLNKLGSRRINFSGEAEVVAYEKAMIDRGWSHERLVELRTEAIESSRPFTRGNRGLRPKPEPVFPLDTPPSLTTGTTMDHAICEALSKLQLT